MFPSASVFLMGNFGKAAGNFPFRSVILIQSAGQSNVTARYLDPVIPGDHIISFSVSLRNNNFTLNGNLSTNLQYDSGKVLYHRISSFM